MIDFFSGIFMATFMASGLFFFKFWMTSRDRFFLLFSCSCWMIALERVVLLIAMGSGVSASSTASENLSWVYLIRLCAFLIIVFAIVEKNRQSKT